jgi:hypothetical protein
VWRKSGGALPVFRRRRLRERPKTMLVCRVDAEVENFPLRDAE